jgi:hypothetical protein
VSSIIIAHEKLLDAVPKSADPNTAVVSRGATVNLPDWLAVS